MVFLQLAFFLEADKNIFFFFWEKRVSPLSTSVADPTAQGGGRAELPLNYNATPKKRKDQNLTKKAKNLTFLF